MGSWRSQKPLYVTCLGPNTSILGQLNPLGKGRNYPDVRHVQLSIPGFVLCVWVKTSYFVPSSLRVSAFLWALGLCPCAPILLVVCSVPRLHWHHVYIGVLELRAHVISFRSILAVPCWTLVAIPRFIWAPSKEPLGGRGAIKGLRWVVSGCPSSI